MSKPRALVMKPGDNVSTVVEQLPAGTEVMVHVGDKPVTMTVTEAIPFGHKFAITDIPADSAVRKYGEVIGMATRPIMPGQHVHVHNIESCRGRGDK